MAEIKGFHTLCTKPYFKNNPHKEYDMQDYEILTMILSALMWRKNNGPITLYGDDRAIDFVCKKGFDQVYDGGIEQINVPDEINPKVFWAAGKLFALRQAQMPQVMVDLDLIIWKNIEDYVRDSDICAIHREGLMPDIYPGKDFFNMKPEYKFNPGWDWNEFPVNTCMLYLRDEQFKKYYVDSAIDFMENCVETEENLCHMVFAEQRLLAMCGRLKGQRISSFFPLAVQIENQDIFTHLWGYKNILKFNFDKRVEFNEKLCSRIERDFPEMKETIAGLNVARINCGGANP
jgi:hypothetical protein